MFKGSIVALATPFNNGTLDEAAYEKLIEFQIENGTDGILPCGCTGEAATLTMNEQKHLIDLTVRICAGRVPVLAGTGSNNTEEAVELTDFAKSTGADAALVITPYYNKPTQEGLYRHYTRVAESAGDLPIMLYNVPSRTGVSLSPDTVKRLSEIPNIKAVKEASGSTKQVSAILSCCDITVMSGDDLLAFPFMSLGATGVVSVAANIIPSRVHEMVDSYLQGDSEKARNIHFELSDLFNAMFIETNPLPVKTALAMMGKIEEKWRLPLCEMRPGNREVLSGVLKRYGLV
jgi:4-hydroxy-tetrahydrodipicolinate synthase